MLGFGYIKAVRDPVSLQELADLVHARGGIVANEPNKLHMGAMRAGPGREEIANCWVQVDFGRRPGLVQVVLDLPEGAALNDRWGSALVTPIHQQRALRRSMDLMRPAEELDPGHFGHPLVRNNQRHLLAVGPDPLEIVQGGARREVRDYSIISTEAPGQRIQ